MKILIFTQKIDKIDSVLGFFHDWVIKISEKCEEVQVVCLQKGEYDLPKNVTVYSLGKEEGVSKLGYILNFYKHLRKINGSYDKVFVHMNQEYILLAGLYWRVKKIPVYLWRNHAAGSFLTTLAVIISTKVFCTSNQSFTARFKKTKLMPVGNDTDFFRPVSGVIRKKYSVCMLGRIAPVKHVDLAIEAMKEVSSDKVTLHIVGGFKEYDRDYYESLKRSIAENNLSQFVFILPEEPFSNHPKVFSSYEINLNLTDSGSFDKTILGGTSCGAIPLVANESLNGILPSSCITSRDPKEIAKAIENLLVPENQLRIQGDLEKFVEYHSLDNLIIKLMDEIN